MAERRRNTGMGWWWLAGRLGVKGKQGKKKVKACPSAQKPAATSKTPLVEKKQLVGGGHGRSNEMLG